MRSRVSRIWLRSLIVGSVFYNILPDTDGFSCGVILVFAFLLHAFGSMLEILTLFSQWPIVEKHTRHAFYHPSAEGMALGLADLSCKTLEAITSVS